MVAANTDYRALSETVCSAEKQSTMSWLGMFPPGQRTGQDSTTTININIPNQDNNSRTRRASYKGIETAMAGGLGKVLYYYKIYLLFNTAL